MGIKGDGADLVSEPQGMMEHITGRCWLASCGKH